MSNISTLEKSRCYSCRSCFLSCPMCAIEMAENDEGFFYPQVNFEKCVDCGICAVRCPAMNPPVRENFTQTSKAVWLKDTEKLLQSTSGGLFAGLAERVFNDGGVVFGAAYDKELNVVQTFVESEGDLWRLKGSKYVESQTGDSFKQAKEFLDGGRKVFYSGTPCQIAGLKKYLAKEYENLLTADLICHGVPSQKLWRKYLEWLGCRTGGRIVYYGFRDKDVGGWSCGGKTKTKTKTKVIDGSCDPYYASFLRCETYRESCYSCPFSSMERPGGVTMGDFWGIEKFHPEIDSTKGVSCVIVNTEKGKRMLESCSDKFNLVDATLEEVSVGNMNLRHPSERPEIRGDIYNGIDGSLNRYFSKFKRKNKYLLNVRRMISKVVPKEAKRFIKKVCGGIKR